MVINHVQAKIKTREEMHLQGTLKLNEQENLQKVKQHLNNNYVDSRGP